MDHTETISFIEDYKKYPLLWNISDKDYTNRERRRIALQKLSEKYVLDTKSLLNRIKCLRSYFHREHNKVLQKNVESSWFAYDHLLFILDGKIREGRETVNYDEIMKTEENCDSVGAQVEVEEDQFFDFNDPSPIKKSKRSTSPSIVEENYNKSQPTRPTSERHTDHLSIFGDYVASKVRKLNNPRLQSIVQHRINTILYEAEMELFERENHSNDPLDY